MSEHNVYRPKFPDAALHKEYMQSLSRLVSEVEVKSIGACDGKVRLLVLRKYVTNWLYGIFSMKPSSKYAINHHYWETCSCANQPLKAQICTCAIHLQK